MAWLSRSSLKRLAKAVVAVERRRVFRGESTRPRWSGQALIVLTGVVTETISARSGNTLGLGKVMPCVTDADTATETPSTDDDDELDVYNSYTMSFAAHTSKRIKIHWEGGVWKVLVPREC